MQTPESQPYWEKVKEIFNLLLSLTYYKMALDQVRSGKTDLLNLFYTYNDENKG
jgi:hypothetical protein